MRSVNKVVLIGNLTRDPALKQTQNGQAVVTFGIATNREWMTAGSEKKQSTEFHEIVAWAKLAEICDKFLKKGKLVYLEGYLKTRSWEDESGEKRYRTEVVLKDMVILEKKGQGVEDSDALLSATADDEDMAVAEEEGDNVF